MTTTRVPVQLVNRVDDQGDVCEFCQESCSLVQANVYGNPRGMGGVTSCCLGCIPKAIDRMIDYAGGAHLIEIASHLEF